jgi:hypothetical protein
VILHQFVDCAFRGAWCCCCRLIVWVGVWLVFRGVQATHESSPIGFYDFGCAEVEELLHEDEHTGSEVLLGQ